MRTRRVSALFAAVAAASAVVAAALAAGCAPALDWREVRAAGGLVALFPCRPEVATREVTLAGQTVALTLRVCSADGLTWSLASADLGDPARLPGAAEELVATAVRNLGAEPRSAQALAVPGATPQPWAARRSLQGLTADGRAQQGLVAVFARGTVVHRATVLGVDPAGAAAGEATETFVSALRFE